MYMSRSLYFLGGVYLVTCFFNNYDCNNRIPDGVKNCSITN